MSAPCCCGGALLDHKSISNHRPYCTTPGSSWQAASSESIPEPWKRAAFAHRNDHMIADVITAHGAITVPDRPTWVDHPAPEAQPPTPSAAVTRAGAANPCQDAAQCHQQGRQAVPCPLAQGLQAASWQGLRQPRQHHETSWQGQLQPRQHHETSWQGQLQPRQHHAGAWGRQPPQSRGQRGAAAPSQRGRRGQQAPDTGAAKPATTVRRG